MEKEILLKLVLSILIGGAIGLEREFRSKSAGFRTLILICLGSTLFTIFSQIIGGINPDRIAANLVVGIGFMGAGVIFKAENNRVNGITTAASMWVTASLGMALGDGYFLLAIVACLLILTVLMIFPFFERYFDQLNQLRNYKLTYHYEIENHSPYEKIFRQYHLKIVSRDYKKIGNTISCSFAVLGSESNHHRFVEHVLRNPAINEFDF